MEKKESVREILNGFEGAKVKEKKGSRLRFRMHLTEKMEGASIEALELSVRAYNSLKRAGFDTVGQVAEAVAGGEELRRIRNCGVKSAREIMESLFLYQLSCLPEHKREAYLREVVALNHPPV